MIPSVRVLFERYRRAIAVVAGVTVFQLLVEQSWRLTIYIEQFVGHSGFGPEDIKGSPNNFMPAGGNGDFFAHWSLYGLGIATGSSLTALLWERRPPRTRIAFVYWALLVFALPLSLMNYSSADAYVERSKQAAIDGALVILALCCALSLYRQVCPSDEARVFRAMALFFLVSLGVVIPGVFASIWCLDQLHIQVPSSGLDSWISAFASLTSAWIAYLSMRNSNGKDSKDSKGQTSVIITSRQ